MAVSSKLYSFNTASENKDKLIWELVMMLSLKKRTNIAKKYIMNYFNGKYMKDVQI